MNQTNSRKSKGGLALGISMLGWIGLGFYQSWEILHFDRTADTFIFLAWLVFVVFGIMTAFTCSVCALVLGFMTLAKSNNDKKAAFATGLALACLGTFLYVGR
jgi:hypothetical protein